jgi:hypothetical protein
MPRAKAMRRSAAAWRTLPLTRVGLSERELAMLRKLDSPAKIQAFINRIPINHEHDGETVLSVREVLRQRRAHCIEGAFVAACALWLQGKPPLVMHMDCDISDYPHVITLFRRNGCWGAVSKTNGSRLRFRDAVYRSLRELALSYFHEYTNKRGEKTLRSYSAAFDLRRIDSALWVTNRDSCWEAHDRLEVLRHYPLLRRAQIRQLARCDPFEQRVGRIVQYPSPKKKVRRV